MEARRESWRKSKEKHKDRDKAKRDAKPKPITPEQQLQSMFQVEGPKARRSMLVLMCKLMKGSAA